MRIIAKDSTDKYIFTDVNQVEGVETTYLDITDFEAIREMVIEKGVKVIVNCAAWTNVDACETDENLASLADKLNAEAPNHLAIVMKEVGGLLIHVSTDYVFGEEPYNIPCREEQQGTPTGVYGQTKLHGEQLVVASGCRHVIIRTAWLYSTFGNNFVKTMLRLGVERAELGVVFDQVGTPTYARDLARAIQRIIIQGIVPGIYHYSNEGVCSWYDFTKMIFAIGGITTCALKPLHTDEYPTPAARPHYSVLDKTKIKQTYDVEVPYWVDSLRECIEQL